MNPIYAFSAETLQGDTVSLADWQNKVLLS
jgi:glutathione peroxidase-family protein